MDKDKEIARLRSLIEILAGKVSFLMALTQVHGQRLARLENVPPAEEPPPQDYKFAHIDDYDKSIF